MRGPSLLDQVLFEIWFVGVGATLYAAARISLEQIGRLVRRAARRVAGAS